MDNAPRKLNHRLIQLQEIQDARREGSMQKMKRKRQSAEFKARVAVEALKGQRTVNELASEYGAHPTQISHWKRQLQDGVQEIFSTRNHIRARDGEELKARLYEETDS